MSVDGQVTGGAELRRKFGRVNQEVRAELVRGMGRITLKLMRQSVQGKLSGQVLKRRTGTLARSVTQSPRTYETGDQVVGTVGVENLTGPGGRAPVKYGRAHEYGFQGRVTVREHLRTVKKVFGKTLASPVQVRVRTHSAQRNLPERSFLRSALADLVRDGVIDAELSAAVAAGLKK